MSLSDFHEVRLPLSLAFGAQGGPERRTDVVTLANGSEARNAVWAGSRRRWELGGAITKIETLHELVAFFEARRGRLHGFRFRDVIDDRSGVPAQPVSSGDQQIGMADGEQTVFAIVKSYGATERRIYKPVPGSVRVAVNGVDVADIAVNTAEGLIRFNHPPETGAIVTAGYLFDVPVRFDTDHLETSLEAFGAGRAGQVSLIELLG